MATDAELVAEARAGSRDAAAELFERHWPAAWRVAFALTGAAAGAEDVAQDSFERAFSALGKFNGRSAFSTWLYRIVVNRALNVRRSEAKRGQANAGPEQAAAAESGGLFDLAEAVARLPDDRRVVVVLRYWLDFTPTEIATVLGLPVGTVHSRLGRALTDLRKGLEST
ncbi:MAG: RNA polymerase sigma factor [Gaiellaceae bacterium MAG52_C11]|nr:RNA polymerase sigma factor [Candidatus Gaiellasilicea maunaloa]